MGNVSQFFSIPTNGWDFATGAQSGEWGVTLAKEYCGRFAPSPTGPLHFGSLVAAVGSYLDARSQSGRWLLRIEDVDTPRTVPGAAEDILATLSGFGFEWDGVVMWQSQRSDVYREMLDTLERKGLVYPCACSRKEIADSSIGVSIDGGRVYPGTCRNGLPPERAARAWRLLVPDVLTGCEDRIQGRIEQHLAREVGDFVLRRADGLFAYQLAVVADDAESGVTDVVRGADLIDSTPRQIWLQQCLGFSVPRYAHLPVATNVAGEKLSKQTLAPAVSARDGVSALVRAMRFLGQSVPEGVDRLTVPAFWQWALAAWRIERVSKQRTQCLPP